MWTSPGLFSDKRPFLFWQSGRLNPPLIKPYFPAVAQDLGKAAGSGLEHIPSTQNKWCQSNPSSGNHFVWVQPAVSLHGELLFDLGLLSHVIKMTSGGNNWHVFGSGGNGSLAFRSATEKSIMVCVCVVCGRACNSHRQLRESLFCAPISVTVTHMHADLQMDPAVPLANVRMTLEEGPYWFRVQLSLRQPDNAGREVSTCWKLTSLSGSIQMGSNKSREKPPTLAWLKLKRIKTIISTQILWLMMFT